VERADRRVEESQRADFGRRDGEDAAHQDLLDVLTALRCLVDGEHRRRGRHRVDDSDDRLLGHGRAPRPASGEERGATEREGERVAVGGFTLDRVAGEKRDGYAERSDLGERQVDEDHAPREHVEPEINVNRRQDQAGQQRSPEQLHHPAVLTERRPAPGRGGAR
jgi:hypothetical protein